MSEKSLKYKNIILGVSGGIAAYKSPDLVRRLRDLGANVIVVMTEAAREFITPLSLQAVSHNKVRENLLDTEAEFAMGHIELARMADLILIAPASANFIARLAHGEANDLLTTLCLATEAPVALAPAMNEKMWANIATQDNLSTLKNRHITILGPASGEQACGDVGLGRMLEPQEIAQKAAAFFHNKHLSGKHVLVTAGPTFEAIDPVRFIGNKSSGKMGHAMAEAAYEFGASVDLILGPSHIIPNPKINTINVTSADDMYRAVHERISDCDIFIGAAAIADYRMAKKSLQKIASGHSEMTLNLVRNKDIIASVAALKPKPLCLGFAAQTEEVIAKAEQKLKNKNLDMIIANDVTQSGIGFDSDDNQVTALWRDQSQAFPKQSKTKLARQLLMLMISELMT